MSSSMLPVPYLLQAQRLADVDEIQDVLLEAAASKAHAGIQELVADAAVHADGAGHLREQAMQGTVS